MSATNVHPEIRAAVRTRLQALAGLPAVSWEGREYRPIKGTPFIAESMTPVSSVVRALGLGGTIAHTITANFTLHFPAGKGTANVEALAGALLEHYRPGTTLAYGTSAGMVQQAERMPLIQEPDWLTCAVIVTIVAHTSN